LGINIGSINVDNELRPFGSKIEITGTRKLPKLQLAEAIAVKRLEFEAAVATGTYPVSYVDLVSQMIRPLFDNRGKSLTAAELTDGKKTDQILCEAIAKEYNSDKAEYAAIAYLSAVPIPARCRPSFFFPNADWKE